MSNLEIWNKVSQAPEWALTSIQGGRLKGKTDINPMWRNMCMTETFGMCGVGWKYEIVKTWTHELKDNPTVTVFVLVNVYVKQSDKWSEPIPSVGGDVLAEMQKGSLFVNDDCYKMAITDALGKAFAMLGVAANTYRKAESKYSRQNEQKQEPKIENPHNELNRLIDWGVNNGFKTATSFWVEKNIDKTVADLTESDCFMLIAKIKEDSKTFKKDGAK